MLLGPTAGYYAKVPVGRSVEIISVDVAQGRLHTAVGDQMDLLESRTSPFIHPLTVICLSNYVAVSHFAILRRNLELYLTLGGACDPS
jgi:hypothetical protein